MTKLDRETEIARELFEKFPQELPAILGGKGRRQLNQDYLKLRSERFDCPEESGQLSPTIMQPPRMGDFAGQFAGETKCRWGMFHPAADRCFRRDAVEG